MGESALLSKCTISRGFAYFAGPPFRFQSKGAHETQVEGPSRPLILSAHTDEQSANCGGQ